MEFAHRIFINDPYIVLAKIIMSLVFFSYATNVQPWLVLGKKRKREMVDINVMLLAQTKGGKKTEIVFLSISLFFPFFITIWWWWHTHIYIYLYIYIYIYTVRTGDLEACLIKQKNYIDEFPFLICSLTHSY
jgi:hypothetical protein